MVGDGLVWLVSGLRISQIWKLNYHLSFSARVYIRLVRLYQYVFHPMKHIVHVKKSSILKAPDTSKDKIATCSHLSHPDTI